MSQGKGSVETNGVDKREIWRFEMEDQHKWKTSTAQEESEEVSMVKTVSREKYETQE